MSIRERLDRLDDRERRLLGVALAVALLGMVLLPPAALFAVLHSRRSDVEAVREAMAAIADSSTVIERGKAEKGAIAERYARTAPQLQAFLAGLASQAGVEIPESQDRQAVPRGADRSVSPPSDESLAAAARGLTPRPSRRPPGR